MKNLATGGLALGGGVGAAVALVNYLKSLQKENELEDESRLNDDTLYISAPRKKQAAEGDAGVNRWLAPGLAVTGGILSAGGAYALTQAVYNHLQKKRRQKLLDEAQNEALAAADLEVEKAAADAKMNLYDLMTAFPVAVPLLAALASGGVSYAALKKTFPSVKKPKSKYPKRIRQVATDGTITDHEAEEDLKKYAAADIYGEADCEDAAHEFLLLTVDQMSQEKQASMRLTSELLHKVAKEGISGVVDTQRDGGLEALTEYVSGAAESPVDLPRRVMAAVAICKSARLRPVVSMLASAEFLEMAPDLHDEVMSQGEEQLEKFAGIAPLMQLAFFRPQMLEKSAMASPLALELQQMLSQQVPQGAESELTDALTSDASGGFTEEAEGGEIAEDIEGDLQEDEEDIVDMLMEETREESPILDPDAEDEEEEKT